MKILLIEDDSAIRFALEALLSLEGYQTRCVDRGEDALVFLTREEFDVILLDLHTDGMSAEEFVQLLPRQRPPLGVVSASHWADAEARKLGADFFIRKPFDQNELLEALGRFQPLVSGVSGRAAI